VRTNDFKNYWTLYNDVRHDVQNTPRVRGGKSVRYAQSNEDGKTLQYAARRYHYGRAFLLDAGVQNNDFPCVRGFAGSIGEGLDQTAIATGPPVSGAL
jgi:hypothetical protein